MNQNNYNFNNFNNYNYQPPDAYTREMMYYNNKKRQLRKSILIDSFVIGGAIIAYLIIQVILVSILKESSFYNVYENSAAFQYAFNIIAIDLFALGIPFTAMAFILKKRLVGPLVPTKKVKAGVLWSWVGVGMGISIGASILTNAIVSLIKKVGFELTQPEFNNAETPVSLFIMLVSMAIVPAIFEEYALRCCTLGVLKGRGKAFSIIAVSIVFGLLHGNAIQFIFAFFVGLICGYITIKTDSVVPAMLIHGFNNGLSVVQEIFKFATNDKVTEYVIGAIILFWVGAFIVGLIYLITNKELIEHRTNNVKDPGDISTGEKLACLLPGLAFPFLLLIIMSTQFIKYVG